MREVVYLAYPASPAHSEQVGLRAAVFVHPEEPLGIKTRVSAQRCTLREQKRRYFLGWGRNCEKKYSKKERNGVTYFD